MVWTLIIAWILTWFDIDQIVVNAINQILNTDYTTVVYWLIAVVIGIIVCFKVN